MVNPHEVCIALRSYRIRGRIKQQIIADALGVAQSQISRWESGRDTPRPHNIEAIKALLWAPRNVELQSLIAFVRNSLSPLVLTDHEDRPLALSVPLREAGSEWHRFSWAFRPERNPAAAAIVTEYRRTIEGARGVVSLELYVPFEHEGAMWSAIARRTIHTIEGQPVSLAEVSFSPASPGAPIAAAQLQRIDAV